jgi:protein-arginine kinase activator protein McsA
MADAKKDSESKNCLECNAVYSEYRQKQRFCSDLCRSRWHNRERLKAYRTYKDTQSGNN